MTQSSWRGSVACNPAHILFLDFRAPFPHVHPIQGPLPREQPPHAGARTGRIRKVPTFTQGCHGQRFWPALMPAASCGPNPIAAA
jgi:hypothetical protein